MTYLINDSSVGSYTLDLRNEGGLALSATVVNFNVVPVTKYIFISFAGPKADMGGFDGADAICNEDFGTVRSDTPWKALLDGNNATTAGTQYISTADNSVIAVATGGDLASTLLEGLQPGGGVNVWTGANGSDCNGWTSGDTGIEGALGITDTTTGNWFSNDVQPCGNSAALICVQQ